MLAMGAAGGSCTRLGRAKLLFLALCLALCSTLGHAYLTKQPPLRISCGDKAPTNVTTPKGAPLAFVPDRKYTAAGVPARVPQAEQHNLTRVEATLRVFPTDATSCYRIPVLPGRFLIRLGWASYNYDGKGDQARFGVLLQGTLVEVIDVGVIAQQFKEGAYYSDYIAFALAGNVTVCLQPMPTPQGLVFNPFLNTIELLPVDTESYDAQRTGQNVILSAYLRMNMGGPPLGPEPQDPGYRTWVGDVAPAQGRYKPVTTRAKIGGTGGAPDHLPTWMFQTCREAQGPRGATGFKMSIVPVDRSNSWYLRYYFAEPNPRVKKGERVFNVLLGSGDAFNTIGTSPQGFDILSKTQPLSPLTVPIFFNFSAYAQNYGQDVEAGVKTVKGSKYQALICGVELYEIIPETGYNFVTSNTKDNDGPAPSNGDNGGLSAGQIAGIVVGTLVGALLLTMFALFLLRKRTAPGFIQLLPEEDP